MENQAWTTFCSKESLQRGWHIARNDLGSGFFYKQFSKEIYAYFIDEYLDEFLKNIQNSNYKPSPLKRISIPKGALGTRPGTILPFNDRIVLFSALRVIAPEIDKQLSENVYSYRTKKKIRKGELFNEGDVISLPFLKNKTVKKYIDPFDPWYGLWPKFDAISKVAFQNDGYMYMATSDISAYFENIQIDLLRDQLHQLLPNEQKIINFIINFFEQWTYDSQQGRRYLRGIPQGTSITSFFGNIFLKPIDDAIEKIHDQGADLRYYRYMDDVRIFTKDYEIARKALLVMDAEIRKLHLNLQTAKTKILSEKDGEISKELVDRRYVQLDQASEYIKSNASQCKIPNSTENKSALYQLKKIYEANPDAHTGGKSVAKTRKPLTGANDRVFRRLISMHIKIGSDFPLQRMVKEAKFNADHRLGLKLIQMSKNFPRKAIFVNHLFDHFSTHPLAFPYQMGQVLQAIKYQSRIPDKVISYCMDVAKSDEQDDYLRAHALYVLSRCKISGLQIGEIEDVFVSDASTVVREASALNLVKKRGAKNSEIIQTLVFHPNEEIRSLGKFLRSIKNDIAVANRILDQAFGSFDFLAVEYCSLLFLMCESNNDAIKNALREKILSNKSHTHHINMDMREHFKKMLDYLS